MRSTYKVVLEMDTDGTWFVTAPEVRGAHSHGRTIAKAIENIREAIAVMTDDLSPDDFDVEEHVQMPATTRRALERAHSTRRKTEAAIAESALATRAALERLERTFPGLGVRDQARLLRLSFQRVQQLRRPAMR